MTMPLEVALRLMHAQALLGKRFDATLSSLHGVSFSDFVLLWELDRAPGGRMRRIDLADAVGLSASGVTRALGPLERIGLVLRESNPRDARVAYAALTATGRERVAEMLDTAQRIGEDLFADPPWTKEDLDAMAKLLAKFDGVGATAR